jgi:hypothetical protein
MIFDHWIEQKGWGCGRETKSRIVVSSDSHCRIMTVLVLVPGTGSGTGNVWSE